MRWEFPGAGFQLDHAYMPARMEPPTPVVALPGRAESDSPVALWLEIAHPHTAARIRAAPDRDALLFEDRIEAQVHAAHGCLWARISAQIYVELADVERLATAVARLARI